MSYDADTFVVTGCSGFIGRQAVAAFTAAGRRVIGVSRTPCSFDGAEFVRVDLLGTDVPHFGSATTVHCAAVTRDGWDPSIMDGNVRTTVSALRLSDGPFVHLSSSSVYDLGQPSQDALPEDGHGRYPFFNSYSESKFLSEQLVLASGRDAVVLRPHAIYGPGDSNLVPRLLARVRAGVLPLPGGGSARHALTSVDNLLTAIQLAADARLPGAHVFNVTDADVLSIAEAARIVYGRRLRILPVPVLAAGWAAARSERRTAVGAEPPLSVYSVQQLSLDRTYNLDRTRAELGYQPLPNSLRYVS